MFGTQEESLTYNDIVSYQIKNCRCFRSIYVIIIQYKRDTVIHITYIYICDMISIHLGHIIREKTYIHYNILRCFACVCC